MVINRDLLPAVELIQLAAGRLGAGSGEDASDGEIQSTTFAESARRRTALSNRTCADQRCALLAMGRHAWSGIRGGRSCDR